VQQRAWQIVADRHYDPALNGVDWEAVRKKYQLPVIAAKSDAEMYLVLKAMLRELKDSHTRIVTPRESADHRRFATLASGMSLSVIDDQLLVIDVDPESPAARADVRKGDVVVAIDNRQFDAAFLRAARDLPLTAADITSSEAEPARQEEVTRFAQLRAVRRALQRMPDAVPRVQVLTLQRDGDQQITVTLMPEPLIRPPAVTSHVSDMGIAVLKLNRFSVRNRSDVEQALRRVADARALGARSARYRWRRLQPVHVAGAPVFAGATRRADAIVPARRRAKHARASHHAGRSTVSETDRGAD
jgi:C-terminal processing protease CtpA/Prc